MITRGLGVSCVYTCFSKMGSSGHPPPPTLTPPCHIFLLTKSPWEHLVKIKNPASIGSPNSRINTRPCSKNKGQGGQLVSARTHPVPLLFRSCVWIDCQGAGGKLREHLLFGELFLEIFLWDCVYCTLECVVMNCIRDIDGRNGKSGGRVLFTGLGLKSRV